MEKNIMEERIITATDLGSSKITVSVARVTGRDIQVVYHKNHPSRGIRNSTVFNPQQASEAVRAAIDDAEHALNIKINSTIVGLPRYGIVQKVGPASVERTDPRQSITREEIQSLETSAIEFAPVDSDHGEMVFGAVTQSFSVDNNINYTENDIIGMTGDKLTGMFKLFIGRKQNFDDLNAVFSRAGLAVSKLCFAPDITAKAVLAESEMENGVAIIDIGAGATSITIYQGKIIRFYSCIPFGGNTVTNDIKLESNISSNLAENIKLAFGVSHHESLHTLSEKVLQIHSDEVCRPKQLAVSYMAEIIEARMREIFNAMLFELQRSGYADDLRSGIVITGGGANLAACRKLLAEMSGYNVRIGWPLRSLFSAEGCSGVFDTSASTALGMILSARDDKHIISTKDVPKVAGDEEESYEDTYEEEDDTVDIDIEDTEEVDVPGEAGEDGNLFGGLFGSHETEEEKQARIEAKKAKEEEKRRLKEERKRQKEQERERIRAEKELKAKNQKPNIFWGKLSEGMEKVGDLFGALYSDTHEDEENI